MSHALSVHVSSALSAHVSRALSADFNDTKCTHITRRKYLKLSALITCFVVHVVHLVPKTTKNP